MRGAIVIALMMAGCATPTPRADNEAIYRCDRSPILKVVFADDHAMLDTGDGKPMRLEQQPAASGFHYASPTHSIRGKDFEIQYRVGTMQPLICVPLRGRRDL